MSFPSFPLRRGMDVYDTRNRYVGSVVYVHQVKAHSESHSAGTETTEGHPADAPALVHEEGATQQPAEHTGNRMLGEDMGPFPTRSMGNTGPRRQSAGSGYATYPGHTLPGVSWFAVRPGRLNLGVMSRPLRVPASAVRSISMERIILSVERGDIPASWRVGRSRRRRA
jgi:hypothetical protein